MINNKATLNILVIGSAVLDTIEFDADTKQKPGGIFYTMLGLSSIKEENDRIDLISNIDKQSFSLFASAFNSANLQYSTWVAEISSVHLKVHKYKERLETYCNISPPLNIPADINLESYDGILINFISGYDINIGQLKQLRSNYSGLIYCDIHSLARDLNGQNERVHRLIPQSEEWLSNMDIVQVNENELLTLLNSRHEHEIFSFVLDTGVTALIVTKGAGGADLYYKSDSSHQHIHIDAIKTEANNVVGCGDIFGAVFFYNYIKSRDYHTSIKRANFSAGKSTEYSSFEQYKQLKNCFDEND